MADVEVRSASELETSSSNKDELVSRLDDLLERYLLTLDAYQKAQQQLTRHLSSGYLDLARANFTNNARARYGQDYYDERMQASRKIAVTEEEGNAIFSIECSVKESKAKTEESSSPDADSAATKETGPSAEADTDGEKDSTTSDKPASKADDPTEKDEEKKSPSNDPIRWFGVLVPPALRSAQASFVSAVEGPVVEISNLVKELRQQEIEIGRVRKQIKKL
ncbi:uncharacterized protein N0V89_001946 [Didymosphaeria variabile]|uniref:Vacuolar ATPase assembly protein VMA22 n=1 Tax=Didymosphaeria variabile TaxID=1932322 RepID=A0A9W8XRM2_9PLEO|nr:uncharacterized protein N0V89_001946 [Didymosphaeria variabile]KAJ4357371.1 hypothetical protein N0V89_001946 [Didymosphaeria variabile]